MERFATVSQYMARYGAVSDTAMLGECLDDATAAICGVLDRRGIDYSSPSEDLEDRLMRTCRAVANRLMPVDCDGPADAPVGVTQMSVTAGPYQQTFSYTPSYGLPKLLPSELDMLGLGGARVGWAPLGGHDD